MSGTKYGIAALERESEDMAATGEGERNNRLNQAAYCMGQLVAGGEIDQADVESVLLAAALAAGMDEHGARATLESGLRGGRKAPRSAPEPIPGRDAAHRHAVDASGLALPVAPAPVWSPDQEPPVPANPWQERAAALAKWSRSQLDAAPDRLSWLQARGISPATARLSGLGFNPGENGKDIYRTRESWGLPEEISLKTHKPKKLWLPVGMVIPMFHPDGRVLRIRFRTDTGEPKYYVLSGSSMAPMVWDNGRQVTVVLESELDGILIHQEAGDLVNVIALGNSSRKPTVPSHALLRRSARILLALDRDAAGVKAAAWFQDTYGEDMAEDMPPPAPHKDAGELAQAGGDVRTWVMACMPEALIGITKVAKAWSPPPANRHADAHKSLTKTHAPIPTPPESGPSALGAAKALDVEGQGAAMDQGAGSANGQVRETPTMPEQQAVDNLRALLARCKRKAVYAAYNDQEGTGGRGCAKCGPGGTSCGLEYEIGGLVCNDQWLQYVIWENGGKLATSGPTP